MCLPSTSLPLHARLQRVPTLDRGRSGSDDLTCRGVAGSSGNSTSKSNLQSIGDRRQLAHRRVTAAGLQRGYDRLGDFHALS